MDIPNPYCPVPQQHNTCAFVGREGLFDHINQYFLDSTSTHAFLMTGKPFIGKTAALHQLNRRFSERYIGVYISPGNAPIRTEAQLLKMFTRAVMNAFAESHLLIVDSRDNRMDDEDSKITAGWFAEVFIPRVLYSIRAHRQLIFLVDDAEPLIDYWQQHHNIGGITDLLQQHDQLHMVLATGDTVEAQVPALNNLVAQHYMHRLGNLSAGAAKTLAQVSPAYTLDAAAQQLVVQLTGGIPLLLQCLCYLLHEQSHEADYLPYTFTAGDVRALVPEVLEQVSAVFYDEWQQLTLNERLVLTALSSLSYRNPLEPVTVQQIENWLVATDYPLDDTAIKSSVRGLEYRLLVGKDAAGLVVVSSILQSWLAANARLDDVPSGSAGLVNGTRRDVQLWAVALAIILILVLLIAQGVIRNAEPAAPPPDRAVPTVTLANP